MRNELHEHHRLRTAILGSEKKKKSPYIEFRGAWVKLAGTTIIRSSGRPYPVVLSHLATIIVSFALSKHVAIVTN